MVKAKKEIKTKKEVKPKAPTKTEVTLTQLLEAGCHFGHQSKRWNPKMKTYLYDVRDGVHIFDLVKTKEGLENACAFLKTTASLGKMIVFVGTKRQASAIVEEVAKKIGVPYIVQRWLGGTITNWEQIKKSIDKLVRMKDEQGQGEYKKYTKKEQLLLGREITKLDKFYGGLVDLKGHPDVLFVVDVKKEAVAVHEAHLREVSVVGVVDSDSDPDTADYVIPCNDDAVGSIKFIVEIIGEAVHAGKETFEKKAKK